MLGGTLSQEGCRRHLQVIPKLNAGRTYKECLVESGMYEMMIRMSREQQHQNVVQYFDFLESPSRYYAVMENLQGVKLTHALKQDGPKWTERRSIHFLQALLNRTSRTTTMR